MAETRQHVVYDAIARAQRVLASVAVDPLGSKLMSPAQTVVPATNRAIAEARSLCR